MIAQDALDEINEVIKEIFPMNNDDDALVLTSNQKEITITHKGRVLISHWDSVTIALFLKGFKKGLTFNTV